MVCLLLIAPIAFGRKQKKIAATTDGANRKYRLIYAWSYRSKKKIYIVNGFEMSDWINSD